jgi:protein phosphatase
VGQIREHNEDNFVIADLTTKNRALQEIGQVTTIGPYGVLLAVCDGMGGAAAGEVASQLAVDIIAEKMSAGDPPTDRAALARRLNDAVEAAGARIYAEANADRARRGMGTTATISALIDDHLLLAEVGDSRGYILRGDKLVQVTRDQSLVNQLIEAGQLTEIEAETFEHNNIILQALGTAETVQVDITYVELRRGDTLLLCSDGLSGMVRFDEIREVLRTFDDLQEICKQLIDRANQAGCVSLRPTTRSSSTKNTPSPIPRLRRQPERPRRCTTRDASSACRPTGSCRPRPLRIGRRTRPRASPSWPTRWSAHR